MSLYLGPELAAMHQAELLEEAANERLARQARAGRPDGAGRRGQVVRLAAAVAMLVAAILVLSAVIGFDLQDAVQIAAGRLPAA